MFKGTSDSAIVRWGTGATADTIVLHFVEDVASSYIVKVMKRPPSINPLAGGHTTLRSHVTCSEFYRVITARGGKSRVPSGKESAKIALHECFHNVWPGWEESDLMGHGGIADTPIGPDLNQWDIDTLRRGIGLKSVATQQL